MTILVRKLETEAERLQAEHLIATAFLHDQDESEANQNAEHPMGDVWGAFDESARMTSAATTIQHRMTFDGGIVDCTELHMIGTLPEARGGGAARTMMNAMLREYRSAGHMFALLIPFSFAFYRKFGFESASEMLVQKAGIDQFSGFQQELTAKRVERQEDADAARKVYEAFALRYNLANLKSPRDWELRGNGEVGERSWDHRDKTHYSYLFLDEDGTAQAYFTFVYVVGPETPWTGTLAVTELAFATPDALHSVFGFIYGMRAKATGVSMELPVDLDLSVFLPECGNVERSLDGHVMARVLDVERVLRAMRHPEGAGAYRIRVEDAVLEENTGTYAVRFADGKATDVFKTDEAADLEVTVETFCQLAVGRVDLNAAPYRPNTKLNSNADLLKRVFVRKPMYLR
ncbi:GNAT family N-acetyltransferase [Slackia heliotrinireducens]|uniref:GNAT family N-acetyltransferase n=1 Tax=Slackia heliotrinireducens TaxID=84110 RepID=UPI0033158E6A